MSELSLATRKKLRSLATTKGRQKHNLFIAEGIRVLEEAYNFGKIPIEVYFEPGRLSKRGEGLVMAFSKAGSQTIFINSKNMDYISETKTPQGILAVFNTFEFQLKSGTYGDNKRILFLDKISDPGNVGTLIRSALAFGFDPIVFSPDSVEPYNGKVIRSSAGAFFGREVVMAPLENLINACSSKIIMLAARKGGEDIGVILPEIAKNSVIIFVVGAEADGLSDNTLKKIDRMVGIDHDKKLESLNAAMAGSIIMHGIYRFDKKEV